MLIIGYSFGIRSERRLCEEVHLNLAYRWFCRLGLEDKVPDHSTFSKNRHGRFRESGAFRHVFESVLQRCMTEGLVRGEGFATDASIIKADAQRERSLKGARKVKPSAVIGANSRSRVIELQKTIRLSIAHASRTVQDVPIRIDAVRTHRFATLHAVFMKRPEMLHESSAKRMPSRIHVGNGKR
jgi:hypothetical protein